MPRYLPSDRCTNPKTGAQSFGRVVGLKISGQPYNDAEIYLKVGNNQKGCRHILNRRMREFKDIKTMDDVPSFVADIMKWDMGLYDDSKSLTRNELRFFNDL